MLQLTLRREKMSNAEFYMFVAVIVAICVVIFLILRAFFCWYWKINKRVDLLEKQNALLEEILAQLRLKQEKS